MSLKFLSNQTTDNRIGIATNIPGTFLQLGSYAVAGKYINQATYPDVPSEHMMHITAPSTNAYYGGGISFGETAFTAANIVVRDAGGSGALDLCFGTGTASGVTEKMRITNNGNVGIGQDTPLNSLDVYRATGDASIRIQAETAANSTILKFRNSNADADITVDYTTSNQARMVFTTDNSGGYVPVLSLEANRDTLMYGNVGIGTTNPGQKLQISGGNSATSATALFSIQKNEEGYGLFSGILGSGVTWIQSSTETESGYYGLSLQPNGGNVGIGTATPATKLEVAGGILGSLARISSTKRYPMGHYTPGETIFEIDPTWDTGQLQTYFNSPNVAWTADADAPGGYAITITGQVGVGGVYGSGFPYIPVDNDGVYYVECYIKNVGTGQTHYMGGNEFDKDFASTGGNPGSYAYFVMSNTNPGNTWTKVTGYISGFDANTTGKFELLTKYWTPLALFNWGAGTGTRACVISGWKVIRADSPGDRYFDGNVGIKTDSPSATLTVNGEIEILKDDITSVNEGGHLTLRSGSSYSYRYNIDNYQDQFRLFKQDDATAANGAVLMKFDSSGNLQLNEYGLGTLVSDSSGNITVSSGGGQGGPYLKDTTDTFTGSLTIIGDIRGSGQQLVLNAGESYSYATGQTNEYVYANAEQGLEVSSSPDNWATGWAGRNTTRIGKADGSSTFPGTVTATSFVSSTDSGISINGITMTKVAANSAVRVSDGLETLGLLRSYAALNVGTTGTFGGDITINNGFPRFNLYSSDAGEDDYSIVNNNGIFGVYNVTETQYFLSLAETTGNATFSGAVGVGVTGGSNAKLEVVATSGEVFRADSNGGAYRLVVNQTGVNVQGTLDVLGNTETSGYVYAAGAVRVPYAGASKMPMIVLNGATTYGLFHTEAASDLFTFDFGGVPKQTFDQAGNAIFVGKGSSAATITSDASPTLTTKGYVDGLITASTSYRGTWDPDVSLNSGYGNPNLSTVTQTSGYYYICSDIGTATPNGTGCEPDSWAVGDWVVWNDDVVDCAGTGTGAWQKIDNSSVLSGTGRGQTVALWEGLDTVVDSETLGNAPITVASGNAVSIGVLTSGSTGSLIVNQEGGVAPVAKFLSRTNKAIVQISDNDTTGYVSSEGGFFSLGSAAGVNEANINISTTNSNVGIGISTTSDGDLTLNAPKLHVRGTDTSGAYNLVARFQGGNDADTTGAAILINHSNDRGLLIEAGRKDGDREVAYFNLISSGATVTPMLTMGKFGSAYNVGIGTTTPDALLEISGNAGADPGPITNPTTFRITDSGNAATGAGDTTNDWGKIEFYSEDQSSSGPSVQAQIGTIYDNIYSTASNLAFKTRTSPSAVLTERLRIKASGALSFYAYGGSNNTGTPTYLLGTDASGDVVKTLSLPSPITSQAASLYDLIPNGAFTTTYAFTSTAGVYAEVMSGDDVITSTGTYSVQMVVNDFAVGGTQYDEKYSGVMTWHKTSTNDAGVGSISEIVLHRSGHAGNQGITYLRTRETTSADNNELKLEIMCNRTYTGASNVVFKFVRLI